METPRTAPDSNRTGRTRWRAPCTGAQGQSSMRRAQRAPPYPSGEVGRPTGRGPSRACWTCLQRSGNQCAGLSPPVALSSREARAESPCNDLRGGWSRLSGRRFRRMVSNDEHGRLTLHRKVGSTVVVPSAFPCVAPYRAPQTSRRVSRVWQRRPVDLAPEGSCLTSPADGARIPKPRRAACASSPAP